MSKNTPIIIHVPHASTLIPSGEWHSFVTPELKREIICMTDHFCDDLFDCEHETVRFPVSRLVCDVERFRDDSDEMMSKIGMGAVYTTCSDGSRLKKISDEHKEEILKTYYDIHHKKLNEAVNRRLKKYNSCLIIDGHSFYPTPLTYETDKSDDRPDICIGTDDFHTPSWLRDTLVEHFEGLGYSVKVNSPFAGALVSSDHYRKDKRVMSVMIEINRRLYIDDKAMKTAGYERVREDIYRAICKMFADSSNLKKIDNGS